MAMQRADGSWIGLLFIVGAIAVQFFKAMSRGKVEPLPPATPAHPPVEYRPQPARPQPAPAQTRAPVAARSELPPRLRDLFETLSAPGGFPPGVPRPGSGPTSPFPVPSYRPEPAPSPFEPVPLAALTAPPLPPPTPETARAMPSRHGARLDLLRLNSRQDWERAILLSELLQPPLALRPEGR